MNYDRVSGIIDDSITTRNGIIVNSFITSGKEKIGNRSKLKVEIRKVGPDLSFGKDQRISNLSDNIDIEIKDANMTINQDESKKMRSLNTNCREDGVDTWDCLGRDKFDPVIGGVSFGGYSYGEYSIGTSGVRVQVDSGDYDGNYMLTNAHNFSGSSKSGDKAYQYESYPTWGTATDIWAEDSSGLDYILVERDKTERSMDGSILHEPNKKINIRGRIATQELAIDQTVYKTGKTSGADKGKIEDVNDVEVEYRADSAPGDSGGPIYIKEYSPYIGEYWVLAGIHYGQRGARRCRETIELACNGEEYSVHTDGIGCTAEAIADDIKNQVDNSPNVYFG